MTSAARREQLIGVARSLFADRGFEGTSVEEIAAKAQVSKPVVYEHFGGKEGLYAVVVDREVRTLLEGIQGSLTEGRPRELIEQATLALLDYVDSHTDGFRILARDSSVGSSTGSFASILSDVASRVEGILAAAFKRQGLDPEDGPDVRPDVGRDGGADRPVVVGRQEAQEAGGRGSPGQSGLERASHLDPKPTLITNGR